MDAINKNPRTLYERFVNVYCRHERKTYCTREELTKNAAIEYKEIKGNPDEVERYISSAPKPKHKQTKLSFVSLSSSAKPSMASALTADNDFVAIPPKDQTSVQLPSLGDFTGEETSTSTRNALHFEIQKRQLLF